MPSDGSFQLLGIGDPSICNSDVDYMFRIAVSVP